MLYLTLTYLKIKKEFLLIFLFSFFSLILLFSNEVSILQSKLNIFIYNFNLEGSGYSKEAMNFTKNLIKFDLESIYYIISSILLYWFKPLIYEVKNLPQLFQSIENLFIVAVLIYYIKKLYLKNIIKAYYVIFSLVIISAPYAIIVSNVGTLSRYRFTIIVVFLLIIFFELNKSKKKNEKL